MTAYVIEKVSTRDRRPRFTKYAIKCSVEFPSSRTDDLVRWLSTDEGYTEGVYGCSVSDPITALGLRVTRGPETLEFVTLCGLIALGAPPRFMNPDSDKTGTLVREATELFERLQYSPCSK